MRFLLLNFPSLVRLIQQVGTASAGSSSSSDSTLIVTLIAVVAALGLSPYLGKFWAALLNSIDNREKERGVKISIQENQLKQVEQLFEELQQQKSERKLSDEIHAQELDRREKFLAELTKTNLDITRKVVELADTNLQMQGELTAERTLSSKERSEHREETRLMAEEKVENRATIERLTEDLRLMTEKYNRAMEENDRLKKQLETPVLIAEKESGNASQTP